MKSGTSVYVSPFVAAALSAFTTGELTAGAEDWPQWGGSSVRNMYSPA
jgi:hypothetical protein